MQRLSARRAVGERRNKLFGLHKTTSSSALFEFELWQSFLIDGERATATGMDGWFHHREFALPIVKWLYAIAAPASFLSSTLGYIGSYITATGGLSPGGSELLYLLNFTFKD
jgi:hypothetical protein